MRTDSAPSSAFAVAHSMATVTKSCPQTSCPRDARNGAPSPVPHTRRRVGGRGSLPISPAPRTQSKGSVGQPGDGEAVTPTQLIASLLGDEMAGDSRQFEQIKVPKNRPSAHSQLHRQCNGDMASPPLEEFQVVEQAGGWGGLTLPPIDITSLPCILSWLLPGIHRLALGAFDQLDLLLKYRDVSYPDVTIYGHQYASTPIPG